MFMMTALSGTSTERNTIISRRNDSDSTATKKIGIRFARYELKSMFAATAPDTLTTTSVPSVTDGTTSLRSEFTRSTVASSCGPVVGVSLMMAASAVVGSPVFGSGPTTSATPSVAASVAVSSASTGRS